MICNCCPRKCNTPRGKGYCGIPEGLFVSKFMLHKWEEPIISGGRGSGAVFFSGCNLRCCYCQNGAISGAVTGEMLSENQILDKIKELIDCGADNVNLVSPTAYSFALPSLLEKIKKITDKPIIFNTGGYDLVSELTKLDGLVDVYLPDLKYLANDLSQKYSSASDYPEIATDAIKEMLRQQPMVIINDDGLVMRGVIIRHLVLPSHRAESVKVVEYIATNFPGAYLSLMRQYTPEFNRSDYKNLNRRVTSFEYDFVLNRAAELNIPGFSQDKQSADSKFTPDFK